MTAPPYPPTMTVGDHITYANQEFVIVGVFPIPQRGPAIGVRLRAEDGIPHIALLSDIYTGIALQHEREQSHLLREIAPTGTAALARAAGPGAGPSSFYLGSPYEYVPDPGAVEHGGELPPELLRSGQAPVAVMCADTPHLDRTARFEALPRKAQQAALDKLAHLREAQTGYRSGSAGDALPGEPRPPYDPDRVGLTARFEAKAVELGLRRRELFRWQRAYRLEQQWGLVDGRAKSETDPLGNLDTRIIQAALEHHAAEVLSSSGGGWSQFELGLQDRLDAKYGEGVVRLPPRTTLRPKLKLLLGTEYTAGTAARRRSRDLSPKRTYRPVRVSRPGEVVMMDTTPLDVPAYDPIEDLNISLDLGLAIDVRTRSIVSWRLTPGRQNRVDAALMLYDMLRPEPMRPHWREDLAFRMLGLHPATLLDHDERFQHAAARPVIYPETVVADHAKVNISDAFKGGCQRLGINFQLARQYQSTDKPHVERLFGTIATQFSACVAGYKGRNTTERGELSEKQARWTVEEIEEFFAEWVISVYQRAKHGGLPVPTNPKQLMSPNECYVVDVMRCGWFPAPVDPDLYFDLLPVEWLQIHRWGVQKDYRIYDHPLLRMYDDGTPSPYLPPITAKGRLPGRLAGQRRHGNLQPIHIDPRDLTHAYFWAWRPEHQQWLNLRWVKTPDLLEPCSETFYDSVRRWMVDHGRDNTNDAEIVRSLKELQRRMGAPERWTAGSRRQLAAAAERARAAARDRAMAASADTPGEVPELSAGTRAMLDPRDVPPLSNVEDFVPDE